MTIKFSEVTYTGDGVTTVFVVPFTFIDKSYVRIYINDVQTVDFIWNDSNNIDFDVAPLVSDKVFIKRDSDVSQLYVDYNDGSRLTEEDLNINSDQSLYLQQETRDMVSNLQEQLESGGDKDWLHYIGNTRYTGTSNLVSGGTVYTYEYMVDNTIIYRYITNAQSGLYPSIDGFYSSFNSVSVSNLIRSRNGN